MSRFRWFRRATLTLALAAAGLALAPNPAQAAATAAFAKQSAWSTGYVGVFTVANDTAAPLTWRVEFDLPSGTTIATAWNARITHSGEHYVAVGDGWNETLAAGASTTFGWEAQGIGGPLNCRLNGASCTGGGAVDIRPPTTPANLRTIVGTNTLTLRWDPSADDVAVTGYEVYVGASLAATVTGTEYVMPTPPPAIFTYRVRALDAAGNASPFATITPGGRPDTEAPTAPANLQFGTSTAGFSLIWTAATDNVGVAGYDVFVNGEHYGATSRTSLTIPPIGFGEFAFTVVAFDGAGLRSAPLIRRIAIDPGPTSDASAPTVPAGLRVAVSATQVTWSWTASTDNVGVAGYQIFRGTEWVTSVTGTSFTEPRPAGQTTFGIRVRAFDAVGNKSAFATLTVVIDPPPPTPAAS
ncbi:cellulose binding domain-containing protein [Dactylosporangium sp. NPDC051484]|uniref:cellulose binding domain-containing protein n=1 Tax=Dactylosporangium sp. NPDC051484 TaxID=3154942 RepID=UPI00344BA0EC